MKQNKNETNCKRSTVAQLMNLNSNLELFPVYVLQYVRRGKNVLLEKKFSCGDNGVFPNPNPCVLILKDKYFYNVWNYNSPFNEIDCPTLRGRKRNKGSNERYKKRFCLRCMVSYSSEILHVCQDYCDKCLAKIDDHVFDGHNENEIVRSQCERFFPNEFCFESPLLSKLNGEYVTYCDYLKTLKNCKNSLEEFSLSIKCKHFGNNQWRVQNEKKDEDEFIGAKYSCSSNDLEQSQYVKCGFCSDFYLRETQSHSCYLKRTDSIFGSVNRRSSTIKSHNIFYYDIECHLETYYKCKVERPEQFDEKRKMIRECCQMRKVFLLQMKTQ